MGVADDTDDDDAADILGVIDLAFKANTSSSSLLTPSELEGRGLFVRELPAPCWQKHFVKKGREGGREGTSTCVDYVGPAHGESKFRKEASWKKSVSVWEFKRLLFASFLLLCGAAQVQKWEVEHKLDLWLFPQYQTTSIEQIGM